MSRSIITKVFLTAFLVRIVYSLAAPAIFYNVDTQGYYGLGMEFFAHPSLHTFVTPYRTPLSGLFFNTILYILGVGGAPFGSPTFVWGAQFIVAVQMIIGAIAFTFFYKVLTRILPGRTRFLFAGLFLMDVFVIGWERTLMTEGLAISISLFITTVLLQIVFSPKMKRFILLWLLFSFGFLLRPSFVVYPVAALVPLAWYFKKHARIFFITCVTLAAATLIPLLYVRINYNAVGYFGIQYEGDIVLLGRILEFHIPIESAKNYQYFYSIVQDSRSKNTSTPTGFQLLWQYDPVIWDKAYRFIELQGFNRTVIFHNLPLYVTKALSSIPEILLEVCDFTLVPQASTNFFTRLVWILQQVYGYAQYTTLAVPFLWVVLCIVFLIKPQRLTACITMVGTIAMSQIVLTAFVIYKDVGGQYGRVISIVRPQMFFFLFLCAFFAIHAIRTRRNKI